MRYIYQNPNWYEFEWNKEKVFQLLSEVRFAQGLLLGKMTSLGFDIQDNALVDTLTETVIKSSEIEGEVLDKQQVRSSIGKKLGIDVGGDIDIARNVDGTVELMLDATQRYSSDVTHERLFGWHSCLFPTGYSGISKIVIGSYRQTEMDVISGAFGKEKIHFHAPSHEVIYDEMAKLITYINYSDTDNIIKAAVVHLWFLTLHPFDDGNGRIARALSDLFLARADGTKYRFYSMSSQIRKNRKSYYDILEKTQKSNKDITEWLEWFLNNLQAAINDSKNILSKILFKADFWQETANIGINSRQKLIINKLLDGFEGHLTSTKWAKICTVSQDTATLDINDLINKNILIKQGNGKNTHYLIRKGI